MSTYTTYTPTKGSDSPEVQKLLNGSVEQYNYVLIIMAVCISVGMGLPSVQINDQSQILNAQDQITSDLNTISSELSKLQSAINPNNGTINTNVFTKQDEESLAEAVSDLFFSNPNNSMKSGDLSITLTVDGKQQTYYLYKNCTWSTTPPLSQNQEFPASDLQMYAYSKAVYQADMDVMHLPSGETSISQDQANSLFPSTESAITDPALKSISQLFNMLNANYSGNGGYGSFVGALIGAGYYLQTGQQATYYTKNGPVTLTNSSDEDNITDSLNKWATQYYNDDIQKGQKSDLDDAMSDTNNSTTAFSNVSQQVTNQVNVATQTLQQIDSITQNIIQLFTRYASSVISNYRT